jgi:hypothetical protein
VLFINAILRHATKPVQHGKEKRNESNKRALSENCGEAELEDQERRRARGSLILGAIVRCATNPQIATYYIHRFRRLMLGFLLKICKGK